MIHIYCRSKHGHEDVLCDDCRQLEAYTHIRLERCPFGDKKPTCSKCSIHCYKPEYRKMIKEVMRFSGPRMLLYHPIATVRHLIQDLKNL